MCSSHTHTHTHTDREFKLLKKVGCGPWCIHFGGSAAENHVEHIKSSSFVLTAAQVVPPKFSVLHPERPKRCYKHRTLQCFLVPKCSAHVWTSVHPAVFNRRAKLVFLHPVFWKNESPGRPSGPEAFISTLPRRGCEVHHHDLFAAG